MLRALGARTIGHDGTEVGPGAAGLLQITTVAVDRLPRVPIVALCDVTGPLRGPRGTVARFALQKGADADARIQMERAIGNWSTRLDPAGHHASLEGAGAAGGAGFALAAALGARLAPGAPVVADLCGLDDALRDGKTVWTGEGRLDATTADGKVVAEVLRRAGDMTPLPAVWIVAGDVGHGAGDLRGTALAGSTSLVCPPSIAAPWHWRPMGPARTLREALEQPRTALEQIGAALGRQLGP
jgi:glycerate kinase